MPTITLSDHRFSYKITRKAIRSLRLKLNTVNSFSISAPLLMPQIFITKFISDHQDWIINNLPTPKKLLSSLTILDTKYQLIITRTPHDSVVVYIDEQKIYINTRLYTSSHVKQLLDKKLRFLALKLIRSNLYTLNSTHHFKYSKVTVRNQSSRFGSCSGQNNLSFNWQIILFPLPIFKHILLHELTHTVVKNHSPKFWNLLSTHDSNWRTHRLWLKKEAGKVMIFS